MCKPHRGGSKAEGMRKICGSKAVKRIFWAHKGGRMRKDGGRSAEDLPPNRPGFSKQVIYKLPIDRPAAVTGNNTNNND